MAVCSLTFLALCLAVVVVFHLAPGRAQRDLLCLRAPGDVRRTAAGAGDTSWCGGRCLDRTGAARLLVPQTVRLLFELGAGADRLVSRSASDRAGRPLLHALQADSHVGRRVAGTTGCVQSLVLLELPVGVLHAHGRADPAL